MKQQSTKFSYFINVKRQVLILSLTGHLTLQDLPILLECLNEVTTNKKVLFVVINFHSLKNVSEEVADDLAKFQIQLRKEYSLFICGINAYLERVLSPFGIIKENEVFPDLMAVIQALMIKNKHEKKGKK